MHLRGGRRRRYTSEQGEEPTGICIPTSPFPHNGRLAMRWHLIKVTKTWAQLLLWRRVYHHRSGELVISVRSSVSWGDWRSIGMSVCCVFCQVRGGARERLKGTSLRDEVTTLALRPLIVLFVVCLLGMGCMCGHAWQTYIH